MISWGMSAPFLMMPVTLQGIKNTWAGKILFFELLAAHVPRGWDKKIRHPPPHPHFSAAVVTTVSNIFPTLPLPGRQRLLLAGVGFKQQFRMEKTYTTTMMKPAKKVICDSQFLTF